MLLGIIVLFPSDVKMIALSCNSVADHAGWIEDIKKFGGVEQVSYPIIEDTKRELAVKFGNLLLYYLGTVVGTTL